MEGGPSGISHATRLVRRLLEHEIEFVIIGGVAAVLHGASVVTFDLDVCLRFSEANLKALAAAVADIHPVHRLAAQKLPLEITDKNWDMFKNIYLDTDWGILDCLGEVKGVGNYEAVLAASEVSRSPGGDCHVLGLEAVIRAKEAAGRPKDLEAVKHLRMIRAKK